MYVCVLRSEHVVCMCVHAQESRLSTRMDLKMKAEGQEPLSALLACTQMDKHTHTHTHAQVHRFTVHTTRGSSDTWQGPSRR